MSQASFVLGGSEFARENIQNGSSTPADHTVRNGGIVKSTPRVTKSRSFMDLMNATNSMRALGRNERKVLVIYTGGTIGMVKSKEGVLVPQKGVFENLVRAYPQLHDAAFLEERYSETCSKISSLVLPETKDLDVRVFYDIYEYDDLLDSSNMTEEHWIQIAEDIMVNYDHYDGFVVLHGTDTLSYTASALSFMFENIGKCIVLTGSQIPIFEPRSDGAENFVSSLLIAGGFNIPEVTLFFGGKLFRGNRTRKISANHLFAFDSPNCVPLVQVAMDFEVNKKAIFQPRVIERCRLHARMSKGVGLLRIFPSISAQVIKAFCQPPLEGVVLESYGAGNIPSDRQDVLDEIAAAVRRGVVVVNITQCATGAVASPIYETGRLIAKIGVVSGHDMTPEAALTKLSYVLSKTELSYQEKVEMMSTNIRGELTSSTSINMEDNAIVDALASSLNIQSRMLVDVTEKVFVALLLHAIETQDEANLKKMLDMGANVNAQNSEGKTPLHEAILRGNKAIVEYMLTHGANVHLKTKCGEPPLLIAVHKGDEPMIDMLLKCGARLSTVDAQTVTEMISLAARNGSVHKLAMLKKAGADLEATDELKQTSLHKAVLSNRPHAVRYLVGEQVPTDAKDVLGFTPVDYAEKLNYKDILNILLDSQ